MPRKKSADLRSVNKMPPFSEEIRDPKALSMDMYLSSGEKKSPLGTGRYIQGMPVLVYKNEDNDWVANCLPFYQIGLGDSLTTALESLVKAFSIVLDDAIKHKYIDKLFEDAKNGVGRPADFYWDEYAKAAKAQSKQRFRNKREISAGRATITTKPAVDLKALNLMRQYSHA